MEIRGRYGYEVCSDLFRFWYGDDQRFSSMVDDFNMGVNKRKGPGKNIEGIYITTPPDFDQPNRFEIYVQRVQSMLRLSGTGTKRLILGRCDRIRNHLQNMPSDASTSGTVEKYPAVAALGMALHALMATRPWEYDVPEEELSSTVDGFDLHDQRDRQVFDDVFESEDDCRDESYSLM